MRRIRAGGCHNCGARCGSIGGRVFLDRPDSAAAILMACQTADLFMDLGQRCMAWVRVLPESFQPRPGPGKSQLFFCGRCGTCAGGEELGGNGNFVFLLVFGCGNEDDEALAVDAAGVDGNRLTQTQAALINDGAAGAVTDVPSKETSRVPTLGRGVARGMRCRERRGVLVSGGFCASFLRRACGCGR